MSKIFFNRIPREEAYGGGSHFVTSMVNYLKKHNHDVVFHLEENIDLIFMIDPRPGDIGYSINHILEYKAKNPDVKIIHRVNENDARKNTDFMDEILMQSASFADRVVFISEWLKQYFVEKGFNQGQDCPVIYNGCNLDHFYPSLSLENKKTEKIKLVTHHWSDNWLKGFDLYSSLDQHILENPEFNFELTYVGRYSNQYTPKATNLVNPLWGPSLGLELRKHDIYITASRQEPCGMHHVEGAASGLPVIYHKDCGGINELCKNHGLEYSGFDDFLVKLKLISENLSEYRNKIDRKSLDIDLCCSLFYDEIKRLL